MPDVIVIAGPNGAGKSTLAPALLRDTLHVLEYVNPNTIAGRFPTMLYRLKPLIRVGTTAV